MSFLSFLVVFTLVNAPPSNAIISAAVGPFSSSAAAFVQRASPLRDRRRRRVDRSAGVGGISRPALYAVPNSPPGGGKGALYSDDELQEILSAHLNLFPEDEATDDVGAFPSAPEESSIDKYGASAIPGIHDWVLGALGEGTISQDDDVGVEDISAAFLGLGEGTISRDDDVGVENISASFLGLGEMDEMQTSSDTERRETKPTLDELLSKRRPFVRAIASDVDGTLISGGQSLHPRTLRAASEAVRQSRLSPEERSETEKIEHFLPATGKTRKGAVDSLGPVLGPLLLDNCPGVYIQGLYCVDADGNVVFERKLEPRAVGAAEALAAECGISIVGYDGDNLYTPVERTDIVTHLHEHYGEPLAGILPSLEEHSPGMHKLLLMDDDAERLTTEIRPRLEILADKNQATVTQALPTMLELLPGGCSKADGVSRLCASLGIQPETELLALGDAENDVGMLSMAAIGVAVGNACPAAREAADFVVEERSEEGGAGVAMEMFGLVASDDSGSNQ